MQSNKSTVIKYEDVKTYDEVEAIGITKQCAGDHINGSVERASFKGRRILTLTEGFDPADPDKTKTVAKMGDETRVFQTVKHVDDFSIRIKVGEGGGENGGFTSRELTLKDLYIFTDTRDNKGATIALIRADESSDNNKVLDKIVNAAPKMVEAHPESFDDWMLIDKDGNRVFFYGYSNVNENGKGVPQD